MKRLDVYLQKARIKKAARYIPVKSACLDVGCLNGELFEYCGANIRDGVGIDPTVKTQIKKQSYVLLPGFFPADFPDDKYRNCFDTITMLAVLEHLEPSDYTMISQSCYNVLKPGGRIILTVPSPLVDALLKVLAMFSLVDGISLEEHHGFEPHKAGDVFPAPRFSLCLKRRFQIGLNNLLIFKKNV